MTETVDLIEVLRRASNALPDDTGLRLRLAEQLHLAGRPTEALSECARVLERDPADQVAALLVGRITEALGATVPDAIAPDAKVDGDATVGDDDRMSTDTGTGTAATSSPEFDWEAAAADLGDAAHPVFVTGPSPERDDDAASAPTTRPEVTLADVAGMEQAKARIEASFLVPLRNPELAALYRLDLRGGLLLYGPPGCGKTFLGRALAGELDAGFIEVGIADVLDMYLGQSERNLQRLFADARRSAPTVIFFDELDALGARRSTLGSGAMRTTVNQLLAELDGVGSDNTGVYVVGATNAPWDVDPALRRPGRFDRTILVAPPDEIARAAIFRAHLATRPVEGIDLDQLAQRTDGFSGADVAHVCATAVEAALMDSIRGGEPRLVGMRELLAAIDDVQPSVGPWLQTARNVVEFANTAGEYDELADYLAAARSPKRRRR
ncbi:ATP-binding protein [Leifsonia sp. C5G2]|uniref:ATP-binding protein n=1 Tax=Leifsonia sp. C5G2 TaxID=2735269 RepID=UPI001584F9BF|nr:ATP-binding protein [Leifsonia sp. C5G2]NUU05845.1 AAA family ATPase [Leifsonia sp. C5G2]